MSESGVPEVISHGLIVMHNLHENDKSTMLDKSLSIIVLVTTSAVTDVIACISIVPFCLFLLDLFDLTFSINGKQPNLPLKYFPRYILGWETATRNMTFFMNLLFWVVLNGVCSSLLRCSV